MYEVAIILLLLVAIAMVALILVQQGKGAGMGASFGAGASNTVFGSAGSGNFLTRSTWVLIVVFFGLCLLLAGCRRAVIRNRVISATSVPVPSRLRLLLQQVLIFLLRTKLPRPTYLFQNNLRLDFNKAVSG